ncbi:expressed unknown protein [Seminavis robusta]|uniref:Uncharacterized protein n=1 Tax=Seminavis robusta TaxID=568900 RepID=A0A9N8ER46_9STRA|nr:expressed unknown protein [Seminavis robusta]|eukprot:Sro1719_g293410.1 n/a (148) ;mRNA; f:9917-10360
MRRANYERERRNLEQASTLFDASETAFQEGDGVVLDAPAMFPTENFKKGDDKEHHGDWVFLLFGYQGMKKRSHKKKKHSQAAEDETQAGANTEGHWIFDDDSIDDFTGILLEAPRDIEVPVEAANSSKHEAGLYAQAAHDIQRRQSL